MRKKIEEKTLTLEYIVVLCFANTLSAASLVSIDLVYTLFCLLFLLVVLLGLFLCVLGTTLLPFMRLVIMTLFERRRKVVLFLRRLLPCARERERAYKCP